MIYRILMQVDTPVGNTLPDMVVTVILCLIVEKSCRGSKIKIGTVAVLSFFFRMWYVADSGKRGQNEKI